MQKTLTHGSLFSGSGGFDEAARMNGIKSLWCSEIEPFPLRVLKKNFPEAEQLGDISQINGAKIPPVDIISGGSPCQDMSIAGNREGLDGSRSTLFHEQIRIVKEMRGKTNGEYPRFMVWENVPGAFSSNKGEDFRCVLEEIIRISQPGVSVPKPPRGGDGRIQEQSWETDTRSLGEPSMLNTGESPKEDAESTLSQILEVDAHPKYYLSAKACHGILRRAASRGKKLPEILEKALHSQIRREEQSLSRTTQTIAESESAETENAKPSQAEWEQGGATCHS